MVMYAARVMFFYMIVQWVVATEIFIIAYIASTAVQTCYYAAVFCFFVFEFSCVHDAH